MRSLVIHAHFYQPPRENPYYDEVETEFSAAPFHDWNARIERECYRTVVAARVTNGNGRIERIVNTLDHISFNVGPTLFEWMERHASDTYSAILAADRKSCVRFDGHGNAIAHPYHHIILPLASRRDKVTEVRWGIDDFRRRYHREPEGMWLPETGVDDETLDVLAEHGIRFTVLAPYQVRNAPSLGHPGNYTTSNGRTIALFPYDGDMSHGIAFGNVLRDAWQWSERIMATYDLPPACQNDDDEVDDTSLDTPVLVSAATDGETYGHHHRFSEMALARVLELSAEKGVMVENFASWLARFPATHDVELVEPSAWSCSHGIERWRSNCGCRMDQSVPPRQEWRTPLRVGLERLAEGVHEVFERDGTPIFGDAWKVRDEYAQIDIAEPNETHEFVVAKLGKGATPELVRRGRELLEMEHDSLRMFTSCAWFFDDIGGLEPTQVLRYASRAIVLSGESDALEPPLIETLSQARSSDSKVGNGADVYRRVALSVDAPSRVAAAAAALVALGLSPQAHLPHRAFTAVVSGEVVSVASLRTGGKWRFRVRIIEQRLDDLTCEVMRIGVTGGDVGAGKPHLIPLAELPEQARHALRAELRNALIATCLTSEERAQLAAGEAALRELVGSALVRELHALGHVSASGRASAIVAIERLLDLLQQLETTVPFDAQTALWKVWSASSKQVRAALGGLKGRMGFV
ncbi:MAG: DUF3536 domain-containing protein [Gemmatimonadaceae bacterium]